MLKVPSKKFANILLIVLIMIMSVVLLANSHEITQQRRINYSEVISSPYVSVIYRVSDIDDVKLLLEHDRIAEAEYILNHKIEGFVVSNVSVSKVSKK